MRLGIFGGSFDPVHYGHLLLAETTREACELDRVWFVPAAAPPHKRSRPLASAADRITMLQLAIGGHEALEVCELEIERGGVSYTVDTLRAIEAQHPGAQLFLLLGADSYLDLPNWREPVAIARLAQLVVVHRPGWRIPGAEQLAEAVPGLEREPILVEMPMIGLSSSAMRERVAAGKSIRYWTPRAVEQYIRSHRLYEAATG